MTRSSSRPFALLAPLSTIALLAGCSLDLDRLRTAPADASIDAALDAGHDAATEPVDPCRCTGTRSWSIAAMIAVEPEAWDLAAARDGERALVVTGSNDSRHVQAFAITRDDDCGLRFEEAAHFDLTLAPTDVALADLDGDDALDLAALASGSLLIAMNTGETFAEPAVIGILGGGSARDLATGDVDGDGHLDVAVGSGMSPIMMFLADPAMPAPGFRAGYALGSPAVSVVLADVTGDGSTDLAWIDDTDSSVHVARRTGEGGWAPIQLSTSERTPRRMTLATLRTDRPSLVVSSEMGLLSRVDESETGELTRVDVPGLGAYDVHAADVDGDGIDEIVAGGPGESELQVLGWSGNNVATLERITLPEARRRYASVDLEGDGDVDLAVLLASNQLALVTQTCAP